MVPENAPHYVAGGSTARSAALLLLCVDGNKMMMYRDWIMLLNLHHSCFGRYLCRKYANGIWNADKKHSVVCGECKVILINDAIY